MTSLFIKGLVVGFCIAAPVGPIAALCIHRTTSAGRLAGLASGLGAAVADALYGTLAAFGVTAFSEFLMEHRELFMRAGGAVLILLGVRLVLFPPRERKDEDDGASLVKDFLSTLVLTLTNPMTFIVFAAIFASFGVGAARGSSLLRVELVAGVFLGSASWWTLLVALTVRFGDRFRPVTLTWINRVIGGFVIVVGALYLFVIRPPAGPPPILMKRLHVNPSSSKSD